MSTASDEKLDESLGSRLGSLSCCARVAAGNVFDYKGVCIPYTAVVTAKTGVKKWSRGQVVFLVSVKRSKTSWKLS